MHLIRRKYDNFSYSKLKLRVRRRALLTVYNITKYPTSWLYILRAFEDLPVNLNLTYFYYYFRNKIKLLNIRFLYADLRLISKLHKDNDVLWD